MSAWPVILHLTGPPGAGKRTVAEAVVAEGARRGHRIVLLDNHRTANLVFEVIDADGVRPVPPGVWDRVNEIREAVYRAIETWSPPGWSFVLTNVLLAGQAADEALLRRVRQLAASRASTYVPVLLTCELDELVRRVPRPDRVAQRKWIDPTGVRELVETRELLVPDGAFELDTTALPPDEAARRLLDRLEGHG